MSGSTPVEIEADALLARVRECGEAALARLTRANGDEAVHAARQAFKRCRAALRLLEEGGVKAARKPRQAIARCARELSALRDASAAAGLAAHLARKLSGRKYEAARILAGTRPPRRSAAWWRQWRRQTKVAVGRLEDLSAAGWEPGSLAAVLEHSVKKVRRTAKCFAGGSDLDRAHEWRKALVVLREQALYIFPAANPEIHHRLHQATNRLGRVMDCRVLIRLVKKKRWPASLGDASDKFAGRVRRQQRTWLKRAWRSWQKLKPLLRNLPIADACG